MGSSTRSARRRLRLVVSTRPTLLPRHFEDLVSQRELDRVARGVVRAAAREAADEYFDRMMRELGEEAR